MKTFIIQILENSNISYDSRTHFKNNQIFNQYLNDFVDNKMVQLNTLDFGAGSVRFNEQLKNGKSFQFSLWLTRISIYLAWFLL